MAKHKQREAKYAPLGELHKNRIAVRAPASTHGSPALVTSPGVRRLFGNVSAMTLWRWRRDDPTFPTPIVINSRLYFNQAQLLAWARSKTQQI